MKRKGSRYSRGILLIIIGLIGEAALFWLVGWLLIPAIGIFSFSGIWLVIYAIAQSLYLITFLIMFYLLSRKVNWVDPGRVARLNKAQMPLIILFYPVLRESKEVMRSTMASLKKMDYPADKFRIIAIPNSNDTDTIDSLNQIRAEYPFLELLPVPSTADPGWETVWQNWQKNPKAYWWHKGKTREKRDLPPKKTRQLIYAFYTICDQIGTDWVLDYIDADSITPGNHFKLAAAGLQDYDVVQSTNVVGNILDNPFTALMGFDHMVWDGNIYPHLSADGKQPYFVLGKGVFYRARDLVELGSFNPWITIEDPEVGLRLWTNGKRLGVIAEPLIEEVPQTFFMGGISQRNRWICGFFQTLSSPLKRMGMPIKGRLLAWFNIVPPLSNLVNLIGIPTGLITLSIVLRRTDTLSPELTILSLVNILFLVIIYIYIYTRVWKRTRLVIDDAWRRTVYLLWINPFTLFIYSILWCIPVVFGFGMFVMGKGLVWHPTHKVDADHSLVRQ